MVGLTNSIAVLTQIRQYRIEVREQWELWKFHGKPSVRKESEINYRQTKKILDRLEGYVNEKGL